MIPCKFGPWMQVLQLSPKYGESYPEKAACRILLAGTNLDRRQLSGVPAADLGGAEEQA